MGSYVLIGRSNVGEEKSYPILIYQSKNNMGQNEFQTKCTIQKLLYSKGDIQWWPWNCSKVPIICFSFVSQTHYLLLRVAFVEHTQQEIIVSVMMYTI